MKVAVSLLIALVVGLVFGGVSMYATWQHDLLCNIHCDDGIRWGYWLAVGASWFVVGAVAAFSASLFTALLVRTMRGGGHDLR